jgi:KipI family sensor histidine kinase inhibitor
MQSTVNKGFDSRQSVRADCGPARPAWRWVSERGLLVETGDATLACYAALTGGRFSEIEDLIPADGSLLVVLRRGAQASAGLWARLAVPPDADGTESGSLHEIAVEYGGEAGPDLPKMAERAGVDVAAYIRMHAAVEYSVAFLGFQPGFPYLRGMPPALHARRRRTPRTRVAAGSIAVGGTYTGIYPGDGPGGWQVIGRTAAVLFNPRSERPALLMPGDRVRFVPA